ncbi:MAG: HNH endonuclease signature motif containing protein, partial [Planctomycetota bacterium]
SPKRSNTTAANGNRASVPPDLEEEAVELVAGLSSGDLEQCLQQAHRDTEVGHRQLAFYLHDMQARGVHQLLGYRSAVHYAVERLDMHRRKAQMLVAVGSALLRLRVVDRAFAEGEISWSKTRLLCRVATEETETEWLGKARELGCRELEWLVRSCLPGDRPPAGRGGGDGGGGGLPKARFHIHAELGALDYEIWEQAKQKLARERGAAAGGAAVSDAELMAELSRMLLSTKADGSIPGRKPVEDSCFQVVVDAGNKRLHTEDGPVPLGDAEVEAAVSDGAAKLTKAQRKRVLDRDGHHCRCCRSPRNLQIHHVRFVSQGGETRANNLLALCSYCHGRIHEGLLRVRGKPHGELEFQDRRGRSLRGALPHRLRSRVAYTLRTEASPPHASPPHASPPHASRKQPSQLPEVVDRAFVLQNLDRLKWRGGKMVLV